jgi:hypothetical protein
MPVLCGQSRLLWMLWMLFPMIVADAARHAHAYRRFCRQALADGFEPVAEDGDPLWRFRRGAWANRQIVDVRIAPGGHQLWVKVSGEVRNAYFAQAEPEA